MSDDQFDKLAKLLDKRFKEQGEKLKGEIDQRFQEQGKKLDQQLARFMGKLTKHIDERADAAQTSVEDKLERMRQSLDSIGGRVTVDEQERAVLSSQVDRHEDWIGRAADAIEVSYDPAA